MKKKDKIPSSQSSTLKQTVILIAINILLLFLIVVSIYYIIMYTSPSKTHVTYTVQKGPRHQ